MEIECLTSLRFLTIGFRAIRENSCSTKFLTAVLPFKKLESFSVVWGEEMFDTTRSKPPNYTGEIKLGPKPCTLEPTRAKATECVLEPFKRAMHDEFKQRNVKLKDLHIWRGDKLMSSFMIS